jgi:hypothetical protein
MEEDGSKKFQVAITIRGHLERVMKSQAMKECYKITIKKKPTKLKTQKLVIQQYTSTNQCMLNFFSMARPLVLFKFQFWFKEELSMHCLDT